MEGVKKLAQNRQAWHEFFIDETYECGIELVGTEVKSIRMGKLNLKDSHAAVYKNEMFVYGMHVSPYEKGNIFNKDPLRTRRLLLHKSEILRLGQAVQKDGYALVPLEVYLKKGRIKLELGLCRGKKLYDKRQAAAERDAKRDIDRAMKER